jgi:hypothetical protein
MRTTIDVPDDLLHRAKVVAAQRKQTLRELVLQGLDYVTRHPVADPEIERSARGKKLLAALQASNTEPMVPLTREEIYDRPRGSRS